MVQDIKKGALTVLATTMFAIGAVQEVKGQDYEKTKIETLNRHITIDAKHVLNTLEQDLAPNANEPWRQDPEYQRGLKKLQGDKYRAYYSAVSWAEAQHTRIAQRAKDNINRGVHGAINSQNQRNKKARTNGHIKNGSNVLTMAEKIRLEHKKINDLLDIALNKADGTYETKVYNFASKFAAMPKYKDQITRPMTDQQFETTVNNVEKDVNQQNRLNQIKSKATKPIHR